MLFKEVIGQEKLKERLIRSVKKNKISHAQLFAGNEGTGHFPLAVGYAQYILCANKTENDSCGQCLSCIKAQQYIHPDIHFSFPVHLSKSNKVSTSDDVLTDFRNMLNESFYIGKQAWFQMMGNENKQGVIGVQESHRIMNKLNLKSFEGGYKILIMWLPETMNREAANKLLKIIEEPPQKTVFLLVSDSQDKILTTILSRMQLVHVPMLSNEEIMKQLIKQYELQKDEAHYFSQLSNGNYHKTKQIVEKKEEEQNHLAEFIQWMRLCYTRNISDTIDWVDNFNSYGRERQKEFLIFCLEMFRQSILGHYTGDQLLILSDKQREFLNKFSRFINHMNIAGLNEVINTAYYHLERNVNTKVLFLDVSLKIYVLLKKR